MPCFSNFLKGFHVFSSLLRKRGRGRGRGRGKGRAPSDAKPGRKGRGQIVRPVKKRPVDDSDGTLETSSASDTSPEVKRIRKAESDFQGRKVAKVLKRLVTEDVAHGLCPGLKTSSLADFLDFICSRVVNASEVQVLKRMKAVMGRGMYFAEFCAGMGTGTLALAPVLCTK